jgi:hypothetical protein
MGSARGRAVRRAHAPHQGRTPAAATTRRNPDAAQLAGLVEAAGFTDVETGTVTAIYRTGSPEVATRWLRDVAPPITALVDAQPPEVQQHVWAKVTQAWAPYTTADGRVRLENQAVWVTGTR